MRISSSLLARQPTELLRIQKCGTADSVAWRCLSLCRDAEAMRIAVVVGKDKLGLPIVSMFEF